MASPGPVESKAGGQEEPAATTATVNNAVNNAEAPTPAAPQRGAKRKRRGITEAGGQEEPAATATTVANAASSAEAPAPAAPQRGAKRKRGGIPDTSDKSTRAVDNLTSEQLERKRRNDREVRQSLFLVPLGDSKTPLSPHNSRIGLDMSDQFRPSGPSVNGPRRTSTG
jgi:hypothetical protein